jgi:hypothetical protein
MTHAKRVFILGAGFSKPAGMPLATELLPLLMQELELEEMREWLDWLCERLAWLTQGAEQTDSFKLNIEQVFHYAYFDMEVHRLRQHLSPVGRQDGPGTPWSHAESISAWLSYLERALRDVIFEKDDQADLEPITRWAETIDTHDSVVTFNYDTLVERALSAVNIAWNHGTAQEGDGGIGVFKLHGSIDWIVAHRSESLSGCDLLFDKENANRSDQNTGHVEDDCRLWRCRTRDQLQKWISGRHLQLVPEHASPKLVPEHASPKLVPEHASPKSVGIAGLGAYKQLHQIPGLARAWNQGMRALYEADVGIVVGFSMSNFDAMAQMQFAEIARKRHEERRPLKVIVVDPFANETTKDCFRRVFRSVEFDRRPHEEVDWRGL